MNQDKPLLSEFLEELKDNRNFINKLVSIFYNDWLLNPDYVDDYSERVFIKTAMLNRIKPKKFKDYRVLWYDQMMFNPNIIEICVEKIKEE